MLKICIRTFTLVVTMGVLTGCITLAQGVRPNFEKLENLTLRQSGERDVVLALGEPSGKGYSRFPDDPVHRRVWSYEFIQTAIPDVNTRILLVFFRDDRFDGYMWFSSNALIQGSPQ